MAELAGEIVIRKPVEAVFDFVADERDEPRLDPQAVQGDARVRYRPARSDRHRAGDTQRARTEVEGARAEARHEIEADVAGDDGLR